MIWMPGAGWDYDRWICAARGCDGEIELDTTTDADTEEANAKEVSSTVLLEARLKAVVEWLETNQPDVFKRGLWDAVNETSNAKVDAPSGARSAE